MNVFRIQGGYPLNGEVPIGGSKNATLAILSAVLMAKGETVLTNFPNIRDVEVKLQLLEKFGVRVEREGATVRIDATHLNGYEADEESVRPIRTSFYLLGPLLARQGKARLPAPGGCKIGTRPVDFHLKGLNLMGANVELNGGVYEGQVSQLRGATIYLDFPSAGATQHLMTTAALADGITVIENAAVEPEVQILAHFLQAIGANIEGAGTSTITIQGVRELRGREFRLPEDRIQAATYLMMGAATRGDVTVKGVLPAFQTALVSKLVEAGAHCEEGHDWVRVWADRRLTGIRVKTMPYPGFPTDIQQPMAALLAAADGQSVIEETIYEARVGHISELNRMGARMRIEGRSTLIEGVPALQGAIVEAPDLRGGAALVLAGLAAEGETIVKNIYWIDRGYEALEDNLAALGGTIERVSQAEWEASHSAYETRLN
ncbi:MAG: UDP-N-acetylglucosamine 1-carboxyvinyltransferase [Chthonomonas sp.]|nr:UDP-N-acetylglucosamine 1-carboxyvinyltransferase [Chthonomonas sp.]